MRGHRLVGTLSNESFVGTAVRHPKWDSEDQFTCRQGEKVEPVKLVERTNDIENHEAVPCNMVSMILFQVYCSERIIKTHNPMYQPQHGLRVMSMPFLRWLRPSPQQP